MGSDPTRDNKTLYDPQIVFRGKTHTHTQHKIQHGYIRYFLKNKFLFSSSLEEQLCLTNVFLVRRKIYKKMCDIKNKVLLLGAIQCD